jgi:hypothetical protein
MSVSGEYWRPIPGYETSYEISIQGTVRSLRPKNLGYVRKHHVNVQTGYPMVSLWLDCSRRTFTVHGLVALTFLGARPDDCEVRHLDGDRSNCHLENLEYGTKRENERDKRSHGTNPNLRKTHCPRSHPLSGPNLFLYKDGRRGCRACIADRTKAWEDRNGGRTAARAAAAARRAQVV